jgi:hypothetical protein
MKTGIEIITEERQRHFNVEGWTPEHDDTHVDGELADAAVCYAMTEESKNTINNWGDDDILYFWPFELEWYKPTPDDRIKELAKAGALVAAEIDRLIRAEYVVIIDINKSGYAGVLPNGNIVDRRKHPEAIPVQRNPLFGTPDPKEI